MLLGQVPSWERALLLPGFPPQWEGSALLVGFLPRSPHQLELKPDADCLVLLMKTLSMKMRETAKTHADSLWAGTAVVAVISHRDGRTEHVPTLSFLSASTNCLFGTKAVRYRHTLLHQSEEWRWFQQMTEASLTSWEFGACQKEKHPGVLHFSWVLGKTITLRGTHFTAGPEGHWICSSFLVPGEAGGSLNAEGSWGFWKSLSLSYSIC